MHICVAAIFQDVVHQAAERTSLPSRHLTKCTESMLVREGLETGPRWVRLRVKFNQRAPFTQLIVLHTSSAVAELWQALLHGKRSLVDKLTPLAPVLRGPAPHCDRHVTKAV